MLPAGVELDADDGDEVGDGNEGEDDDEEDCDGNEGEDDDVDEEDGDGIDDDEEEDEDDEDDDDDDEELEGIELELEDGLDCWVTQPDATTKTATVNNWRHCLFMVFMSTFAPSIGFIRIRTSFCIRL